MKKLRLAISLFAAAFLMAPAFIHAGEEEQIKTAIAKAVQFLKTNYRTGGAGPRIATPGPEMPVNEGPMALSGIALLEAKVKTDDPVIIDIAGKVRNASINQTRTYHLALDIIFLDKLGVKADTILVQSMAARLILGQTAEGGWSYNCPGLDSAEKRRLTGAVTDAILNGSNAGKQVGLELESRPELDPVIRDMLINRQHIDRENLPDKWPGSAKYDDNSNTQFALLALWSARRHGVPVEPSLQRVERRFRLTQINGGWCYQPYLKLEPTPSMTCAGLLGLAVSSGVRGERILKSRGTLDSNGKIKINSPNKELPKSIPNPLNDPAVRAGIAFLSGAMTVNRGSGLRAPGVSSGPGGPGPAPPGESDKDGVPPQTGELREDLYFLWSLERVCVVFGLTKVGPIDWHAWGREWLLKHQKRNGAWEARTGEVPDTSFGLMFLLQANIVRDLTRVLKASTRTELSPSLPRDPKDAGKSGEATGNSNAVDKESELARALLNADPGKQKELIGEYATKHGSEYSLALSEVIPKLSGDIQNDARDALATRMSRQKAAVIREWLVYDNAEIRRAAAIGASVHEEARSFVPDLINALDDPAEIVWRGAGLALRTISKKDFGPRKNDSEAERRKAKSEWEAWWKSQH
jgi:hypothetical protein